MTNQLAMRITFQHLEFEDEEAFFDFILDNTSDVELYCGPPHYRLPATTPPSPALQEEAVIILNSLGAIASIASLLWLGYEKFFKKYKKKYKEQEIIHIFIDYRVTFTIGEKEIDKDTFIKNFVKEINKYNKRKAINKRGNKEILLKVKLNNTLDFFPYIHRHGRLKKRERK